MKFLKNEGNVANIPIGYTWESRPQKASLLRTILFTLLTGDRNKIHVNPLTFFFFKSNLGGLTCPGDMVLSLTKKGIYQIFGFEEDVEVIAYGYESVEFKRPLRVGSLFRYRYTLLSREIKGRATRCRWWIEVIDERNKIASVAVWENGYLPVARTVMGEISVRALAAGIFAIKFAFAVAMLVFIFGGWFFYHPMNEYCYPLAP